MELSIKQRVCQSNRECVNQTESVSIKQRVCQSNRECVNQTESVSIKQRVCQSNRERVTLKFFRFRSTTTRRPVSHQHHSALHCTRRVCVRERVRECVCVCVRE